MLHATSIVCLSKIPIYTITWADHVLVYLSSNDFDGKPLIVHLFEETKNNAKLLNHNCNEVGMPCIHSTYNHNHQGPPCVPTLYNPSFAYTPPGILEPSIHSYTWCSPVMISCGIACPQFSAMLSSSLSDDSIYAYPVQQQKLELACNSNMKTNRNQSRGIFLRQLPFNVTAEELTRLLKDIGMPVNIEIPYRRRGTATIYFSTSEEALRAVNKYNGFEYKGLLLRVKLDWNGLPPRSTTESAKLLVNRSDPVIVNGSNLPP